MEWTFEEAKKQWTPMVRPVQHIGVPGYQFQTGVMWDGSLVFGPLAFRELKVMQEEMAPLGDHLLHLSVGFGDTMRFVDRHGTNSPDIRRGLIDGRLPIPYIETKDGDLTWRETVFAHLLDRPMSKGMQPRPDDLLIARARFHVRNNSANARIGHLWLHFGDVSKVQFGYKCVVADEPAPEIAHQFEAPFGIANGKVRYIIPTPNMGAVSQRAQVAVEGLADPARRVIEWAVPLGPGEEAELLLIIPYGLVDRAVAEKLASLDNDALQEQVIAFWRGLVSGPGRITTPDPFVNDYLAAVAGQMAQQVAHREHSDIWMYKTSPNHYEGYWPCNAAKALPALDLRGLRGLNEHVLGSFMKTQTDDYGKLARTHMGGGEPLPGEGFARIPGFLGNFGEWTANTLLISHGLEMWALASHYRITRDRKWLGEGPGSVLQSLIDAFDWAAQQRRRTMREENGPKVPYWGLLPAASAHDWLAGNTVFNDAFIIYGMTEVVRLLREIKHPRAEEMAAELADYRQCLHDRYREARDSAKPIPQPDGSMLPYVPRMVQELDWRSTDWTITILGPVRAGALGAFDPDDELVDQALAFLDNGMPKGEGAYYGRGVYTSDTADRNWADISDPEADRHYLWRHYVDYETMWPMGGPIFLARDDLPRFFEWLFNTLAVVLHHDWRVGVESLDGVPSCAPGDGERWQYIRRMFVSEYGGYDGSEQSLFLFQAMPRSWLSPGAQLSVEKMGTWFGGTVDLSMQVAKDGNSVAVRVDLDLVETPKEVRVRLRSGDGLALRSATVNGKPVEVLEGDVIVLPTQPKARYEIIGRP
jgi:hypothetical protein